MNYTKNTWKTGDIVTSEKLNHIEDGIANAVGVFIVGVTTPDEDTHALNKTWQEIRDAMQNKICIVVATDDYNVIHQSLIEGVGGGNDEYVVLVANSEFLTSTANGYPALRNGVPT